MQTNKFANMIQSQVYNTEEETKAVCDNPHSRSSHVLLVLLLSGKRYQNKAREPHTRTLWEMQLKFSDHPSVQDRPQS